MEQMRERHKKFGNIIFLIRGQQGRRVSDSTRVPIALGLSNVHSQGEKPEQKIRDQKYYIFKKGIGSLLGP